MPNIFLSSGVKFNPFTYDELVKPLDRLYQEHSKIEEGLSELQVKAGIWEGLANQQSDPDTYAQYKRYADELRLAANDLAINGLNATSRQNLFNMKARYASEITPIEQAYMKREKLAEEQRKLNAQSGFNTRFDNDFSTISLDKLMANPQLSYTGINGDEVVKRTSQMAAAIGKAISRMPEFVSSPNAEVNKQYFMQKLQQGATLEEVLAEITGKADAPKELSMIRQTIKSQLADNPAYDEQWVNSLINQGMYSAIGSASYDLVNNKDFISRLQAAEDRRANARLKLDQDEYHAKYDAVRATLPDGTEGYADSRGFFTRDADGVKHYRYDIATASGKPVNSNLPDVSKMSKETTGKGTPTGRYYDPKTKKYYNADGSICANQGKMTGDDEKLIDAGQRMMGEDVWTVKNSDGSDFTRDYVNGNKMRPQREDKQDWIHDNYFSEGDAKKISWDDISKEAETNIQVDVANEHPLFQKGARVRDYFDLYEDYDLPSYSRYRIVPKTNDPVGTSYKKRTKSRTSVPNTPTPVTPNSAIPDSVGLTEDMFIP